MTLHVVVSNKECLMSKFVQSAVQNTINTISGHFNTLLGERPAGSQWGGEMTKEIMEGLNWEEFSPAEGTSIPGCRYFKADISSVFPKATLGAIPYYGAMYLCLDVRCVDGVHGRELVVDPIDAEIGFDTTAKEATLIVGDNDGVQVVYTVHPGMPLSPLPKDWDGGEIPEFTAVKFSK